MSDGKPKTYADAVEEQADFEGLVREKGDYDEAVRAEQRDERPSDADEEAVSGT
ncbi:MAG TPA: hypothetical protein VFC99_13160 [Acidimicrobiia bacterium]|nr:hypothetical protein [Acidimicrobiia bacterium]